jgi:hypothetical protein
VQDPNTRNHCARVQIKRSKRNHRSRVVDIDRICAQPTPRTCIVGASISSGGNSSPVGNGKNLRDLKATLTLQDVYCTAAAYEKPGPTSLLPVEVQTARQHGAFYLHIVTLIQRSPEPESV